jgi:glycosyltransferase involved in cell wall biosynthesis
LREELERLVTGEPVRALRVLGHRGDVDRLYAASDIVVLASHRETLGYSVLEGMSWGLAPIVSEGIGCAEAAGESAIVVRCGDVSGFAAALRRLATDESERAARGAAARERVARLYGVETMIRDTQLLYEDVAGGRRLSQASPDPGT